jgi:hypothetical protein
MFGNERLQAAMNRYFAAAGRIPRIMPSQWPASL